MNETWMLVIVAFALIVLVVLMVMAWYYTKKVKEMEAAQKEAMALLEKKLEEQREKRKKSIRIIAQGVVEDQLTLTEGAIRLSALLGSMEAGESHKEEFKAVFLLAEATSHIPVLDEWKALSTKKKMAYDSERVNIESDHKEFVLDAAQRLLDDPRFQVESVMFYQAG
ncbi:MAG: hypothetical protein AseanaTS_18440 [Candidatus Pelagadaptatus aseana]|uniref:DUF2489 domain-containing protein n=1 Tax=Candidatus Pelagadaptatus aseana TaxID=3120508 RepID=UPI0039B329AA